MKKSTLRIYHHFLKLQANNGFFRRKKHLLLFIFKHLQLFIVYTITACIQSPAKSCQGSITKNCLGLFNIFDICLNWKIACFAKIRNFQPVSFPLKLVRNLMRCVFAKDVQKKR